MNNNNDIKRAILSFFLLGLVGVWGANENVQRPVPEDQDEDVLRQAGSEERERAELRQAGSERPERAGSPDSVATLSDVNPHVASSRSDRENGFADRKRKFEPELEELDTRKRSLLDGIREISKEIREIERREGEIEDLIKRNKHLEEVVKIIRDNDLLPKSPSASAGSGGYTAVAARGARQVAKIGNSLIYGKDPKAEKKRKALTSLCILAMAGFQKDEIFIYFNYGILSQIRKSKSGDQVRIEESIYRNVDLRIEALKGIQATRASEFLAIAKDFVAFLDTNGVSYDPIPEWERVKTLLEQRVGQL